MKKAVILLSGGLDSTTCLAYARSSGFDCYSLSFDYGQRHRTELSAAEKIANTFNVKAHKVVSLSMGDLGGSALTNLNLAVPHYEGLGNIPITYVPARNTVFLSIALGWAEILEADAIFIGVSAIDYSGYPDCRPEYINAFQALVTLGTKCGLEGRPIKIETPLIHLSKAETIALGTKLGVDYSKTISCYQATHEGLACGQCDSCYLRRQGFKDAKVSDPTLYFYNKRE